MQNSSFSAFRINRTKCSWVTALPLIMSDHITSKHMVVSVLKICFFAKSNLCHIPHMSLTNHGCIKAPCSSALFG